MAPGGVLSRGLRGLGQNHNVGGRDLRYTRGPAILLGILLAVVPLPHAPHLATPASVPGVLQFGPLVTHPSAGFWGVGISGAQLANSSLASQLNETPLVTLRYGGYVDNTNVSNGCNYSDSGACGKLSLSYPNFKILCAWIHCQSVVGVPAETNDPGLAADTVAYVEQVVGLHPTFWSIGNEPQGWNHFNIPFTSWKPSDHSTPTAFQIGRDVVNITRAIHSVDPLARVIGDQDAQQGSTDHILQNISRSDNANLSAVAFHSYPGRYGPSNPNDAQFLSKSNVTRTLSYLTADATAYRSGCGCNKSVMVGEFNGGEGGTLAPFISGYPDVPMTAAVAIQLLEHNASALTFFSFWGGQPYDLVNQSTGRGTPTFDFFADIAKWLPMGSTYSVTVNTTLQGVYAVKEVDNSSQSGILLANTNTSATLNLTLGSLLTGPGGTVVSDAPGIGVHSTQYASGTGPTSLLLGPEQVELLLPGYFGAGPPSSNGSSHPGPHESGSPTLPITIILLGSAIVAATATIIFFQRGRVFGRRRY